MRHRWAGWCAAALRHGRTLAPSPVRFSARPPLPARPRTVRRPAALPAAALALFSLGGAGPQAWAQPAVADTSQPAPASLRLQPSQALGPPPASAALAQRPIVLQADRLVVRPDRDAQADGAVEVRRAGTLIRADHFFYDSADDRATARGQVLISRDGVRYTGPELQLQLERFEGYFLQPRFEFTKLGAGGQAERIDFFDANRLRATRATYTSCSREDNTEPDWELRTDRIRLDFARNEGLAEGAVLRFLGVPILGLPVLSFPLTDQRKSGWLPPTVVPLDSRNGFTLAVPYYWNIAPNRDATLVPTLLAKRGLGLDSEFRYLEPGHSGRARLNWLPQDNQAGRARHAWELQGQGRLPGDIRYNARLRQVSDDAYWQDFPRAFPDVLVQRLLSQELAAEREISTRYGTLTPYARVQHWQVLQTGSGSDLITAPYQRSPQIGLRLQPVLGAGWRAQVESELNHFTRPNGADAAVGLAGLPTGWRWHALGQVGLPMVRSWGWLSPSLKFNAAAYALDALPPASGLARRASRLIPTLSLDAGLVFERQAAWLGRQQRQTLEPRLLYLNTPFRDQSGLPNFDAAERDFNALSIYADNAFSGVDRVSDAHQFTAGVTTRLVDAQTGAETLRLGLAQRLRLRDQRVVLSGGTLQQRVSDVLVEGASSVFNPWVLDAALQYNPDTQRVVRAIAGARYTPAPLHTLSVRYRLAKGLSEQLELGWQWPVYRGTARPLGASGGCGGTLYAVGRYNYSLKDSRATDSMVGFEYDTGCWIARVVGERLSTGRLEASTRLLVQLELSGLSRLGANPLQVLKDNIPGYRLLREPVNAPFSPPEP